MKKNRPKPIKSHKQDLAAKAKGLMMLHQLAMQGQQAMPQQQPQQAPQQGSGLMNLQMGQQ